MLKFFRRIRRRLIDERELKRYFIYAFGEILLVVIGILIAVQLNNWNQDRISTVQIEVLLNNIEEDLARNIIHLNDIINIYQVNDSLTKRVINNQVTLEDYYRDDDLGNLLFRFQFLNITYENIDKLLGKEEIEGYHELLELHKYEGMIAIHDVLVEIDANKGFEALNYKNDFMFIIDEHDSGEVYPLLIKKN